MARPTAIQTPLERATSKTFRLIAPPEISSTCFVKTQTAGSAQTTIAPKAIPKTTKSQRLPEEAKVSPITVPAGIKPPLIPVKKRIKPKNAYTKPTQILII